jgi:ATP-binding cassette subfamily C (CFTR/MRP) protein 1
MTTKLQPSNNKLGGYGSIEIRNEQEEDPLLSLSASATRTSNLDPYANSSRWSQLTFGWLSPVLELSNAKGRLDVDDLRIIPLPFDDSTSHVTDQFQKSWAAEVERAASLDIEPTLLRALWGAYYLDFCKAGFLKFVHDLLQFVGPQVLNGLVTYIRTPDAPLWHGLSLTLIVTVAQIIMSITLRHYFFTCYRVGLRLRTAVVTAIYQKALVIAGNRKSVGEITNLMSVDAQRLQDIVTSLHSIWYSCLQITLAVFFLWQQMGVSILSGVFVIILSGPLTAISAGYMGRLQKDLMISKDKRIEVNNEVLGNMKIVKLQAWEKPFQEKLEGLRSRELNHLFWYLVGRMFTFLTFSAVPLCISLATFGTYVLLGNKLDVASALTALALFEILRFPLYMLPNTINSMVEANVALNRVNSFLVSPEHQYVSTGSLPDVGVHIFDSSFVYENKRPSMNAAGIDSKLAKDISDADWEMKLLREQVADAERKLSDVEGRPRGEGTSSNLIALSRVNVKVEKGEFIAVVGGVGSGKSTLLKALLGELRQLSGGMHVRGSVSYSAQSSYIMNATVKENILFGKRNDNHGLYKKALEVCALEHDLELLPQGDLTEIGEKGITLSGGQKARIGMARALYHDADIFLLDDPLAAVDANVGRQIFEDCIVKTMLAPTPSGTKRTVILVTNALQYLSHPLVDRIVVLKEGSIIETGTYDELNGAESSQFKTYLNSFNQTRVEKRDNESGGTEKVATTVDDTEPGQFDGSTAEKAGSVRKEERVSLSKASLMTDEMQERETGTVSLSVYLTWAKAAGGYWVIGVLFAAFAVSEGSTLLSNWFLTYWSAHGSEDLASQIRFLGFYALINVMAIFFNVFRSIILMLVALRASRKLFTRVLDATMRAPMSFFDTTPLGRIINRFSKGKSADRNCHYTVQLPYLIFFWYNYYPLRYVHR